MNKFFLFILLSLPSFLLQGQRTLQIEVNNLYNDVEIGNNNAVNFTSSGLELHGKVGNIPQETLIRFEDITLPSDAVINKVYLVFHGRDRSTTSTSFDIYGEIGNSQSYPTAANQTTANQIKSRNYTSEYVNWQTTECTPNQKYTSPDLKELVEKMHSGAFQNINLAFRIIGNQQGAFTVHSFSSSLYRPKLVIEYQSELYSKSFPVLTQNDDVEITNTNNVNFVNSGLALHGKRGNTPQETFIRFSNISLPTDAVITNAYLVFYGWNNSTTESFMKIYGEIGDSQMYPTSANQTTGNHIKSRNYTEDYIEWQTSGSFLNKKYTTPDLKDLLEKMFTDKYKDISLAFKISGNQEGTFNVHSFSNANYKPSLVIEYRSQTTTNEYLVENNNNDANETISSGNVNLASAVLELGGKAGNSNLISGIRFENINIPENAYISDAYIEFYTYYESNVDASIRIFAENSPSALIYSNTKKNLSDRKYTTIQTEWNVSKWPARHKKRTPNLRNLIDQIRINGWQSGSPIAFKFESDTGAGAIVYSKNGSVTYQPRLVIEYLNNGRGPVIEELEMNPANMTQLFINEVSSQGTIDQKEDWIELYNNHDFPIYIKDVNSGIYLSDKNNNRTLSELRDVYIPAKGFAVFIADSKPEKGKDHLKFGLSEDGETVYLSRRIDANTVVEQDRISFPKLEYNQSYGRVEDGNNEINTAFTTPTYNRSNAQGQQLINLAFSHERGVYPEGFQLSISEPEGTIIKYTLDGKFPSQTVGTTYTSPINIDQTKTVKVFAYNSTGNSGIIAHTYVLQNNYKNEVRNGSQWYYKSNISEEEYARAIREIPIVSVSTNSDITTSWKITSFEYIDQHLYPDRKNFFSNSVGKKFGQESIGQYNSGVKFKFNKDADVKKAKYPFFDPYPGDVFETPNKIQTIELKEGQDGPSRNVYYLGYMRYSEKLTMNLQKEMGKYALDTRFVHLFINGKYRGVRTMRNDFKQNNIEEVFGDDADNYTKITLQDGSFSSGYVSSGDGITAMWTKIKDLAGKKDFQGFKELVDIDDFIKFQIMFMFIDSENEAEIIIHNDAPNQMKAKFMISDTDGAFFGAFPGPSSTVKLDPHGMTGGGGNYKYKWIYNSASRNGPGRLFEKFMGQPNNPQAGNLEFKTLVKDIVLEQIGPASGDFAGAEGAPLSVANVQRKMIETVEELDLIYKLDAAYWPYNPNVYYNWKNIDHPRIVAQVPERVSFTLKKWLEYNMAHTLLPAEISNDGNLIMINNPNQDTQLYYTIDGTDPMGNDGVVSPSAKLYTGSFVLEQGEYTIFTRAFSPNNWGPKGIKNLILEGNQVPQGLRGDVETDMEIDDSELIIEDNWAVYPNPVYNLLYIDNKSANINTAEVAIYAMNGELKLKKKLNGNKNSIDVSSLPAGIYLVNVYNQSNKKSFKIIKK